MDRFRWMVLGIAAAIVIVIAVALFLVVTPGTPAASTYGGTIPAAALLRVPVTGIYPGGNTAGLNANMPNPLANDPDAIQRGMKDFDAFNCSGCHMANAGGGMGPSLSDDVWIYRSSPANIYLTIVQGRQAGMPAFGAMLPDRTVWELVAYIQSISKKPGPQFGVTTTPEAPDTEQIPAGRMQSATPWNYTEPMPPNGQKPGGGQPDAPQH
ncbi:MAG TPA: c-type cytochrome [Rhizomicrobium sp.]|jgi:cytochrome c oxidase cbb3-type subunit 3